MNTGRTGAHYGGSKDRSILELGNESNLTAILHELRTLMNLTSAFFMDMSKMKLDAVNLLFGDVHDEERYEKTYEKD